MAPPPHHPSSPPPHHPSSPPPHHPSSPPPHHPSSPPPPSSLPSFFDPALHLHSDPVLSPSALLCEDSNTSFSSDIEALNTQTLELIKEKTESGVVIQHTRRFDALRSDDVYNPETPTKKKGKGKAYTRELGGELVMAFASSPVAYPPSSSPLAAQVLRESVGAGNKRKRIFGREGKEGLGGEGDKKKRKIVGGFVDDEDDEDEDLRSLEVEGETGKTAAIRLTEAAVDPELQPFRQDDTEQQSGLPVSGVDVLKAGRDAARLLTSSGKRVVIPRRSRNSAQSYESIIAARSATDPGKAKKSYYGIEIHKLIDEAKAQIKSDVAARNKSANEQPLPSIEPERPASRDGKNGFTTMWTETYRAKRFTDLVGDERTHRQVLRWVKGWDPIVFPGSQPPSLRKKQFGTPENPSQEKQMRKIMLLTGPPGLGKTTLAHVCAKQAGYEVLEINASDERSRDVVKGRIKDAVGTENVRGVNIAIEDKKVRKAGKPVCVVVDEVDGVVSGSAGSGEGGFVKALIDLVQLDQKNSGKEGDSQTNGTQKRKGDTFRLLRPLILICNDVYHPSLRPLRASSIAEIVHMRRPPLDKVILRLKTVLDKEGIQSDVDGVRRLCETTWGIGSRKQGQATSRGSGEGDMRGILVAGEWAARKLRSTSKNGTPRLTRKWIEEQSLNSAMSGSTNGARGLGRGGVREVVERVFLEGAGLTTMPGASTTSNTAEQPGGALGVSDIRKRSAMNALREMLDTTGEHDRCVTDCFSTFPSQVYQDDTLLSKPNHAYDWLHFHDSLSSRVFGSQEWELMGYLPQATLAFHNLFAAVGRNTWDSDRTAEREETEMEEVHPFSGTRADFAAHEAHKQNSTLLSEFQSGFSPALMRLFRSLDSVATELLPNVMKMTAPDVKPVVVGGSAGSVASVRKEAEKQCIMLGVRAMSGLGIKFDKTRVEFDGPASAQGGWIYRMEPALDELTTFYKGKQSGVTPAPVRYAVRQVLDQELRKEALKQRSDTKQARYSQGVRDDLLNEGPGEDEASLEKGDQRKIPAIVAVGKRDFFGRIINEVIPNSTASDVGKALALASTKADEKRVWVSFHEGYSNAVRKPITLKELMGSFL